MAYRFFLNVDQCLNMDSFAPFFYRDRSERRLYIVENVKSVKNSQDEHSFEQAAVAIRRHLDENPHEIEDYQIIFAMRSSETPEAKKERFEDTLLYKLLRIDLALRCSGIIIRAGYEIQTAVNLIMLYDADVISNVNAPDPYMDSSRLIEDCRCLLGTIGVPDEAMSDLNSIKEYWKLYVNTHGAFYNNCPLMSDGITRAEPIYAFFSELFGKDPNDRPGDLDGHSVIQTIIDLLKDYQVFELVAPKNQRAANLDAMLRIVEFATTVTAYNNGPANILTDDCRAHWESICKMASADIRNKYAGMLYYYRKRLREYISEDSSAAKAGSGISHSSFPSVKIPSEDRIGIPECPLDAGFDSGQRFDPKSKIDAFRGKLHDTKSLMTEWENTYKDLMGIVVDIDEQLSGYAGALGEKCGENIGEHKKAEKEWNSKIYAADRSELPDSSALAKEKKEILESLSCTEMTPSLNFQDQLNMEDSLREGNSNIRHYIGCIQAAKSRAFLLLVLLLTIMVVIHYSVLQPYNFTAFDSLLFMAAYIVCSAVLMLCSWTFPMRFYRKKIRKCLDELKEEMSRKIEGYFKRAKQFRDYTNAINRLDYIDRYLSFAQSEKSIEQTVRNAKNWHKEEANKHLKNLGYFDSLISTCHENDEVPHKTYRVPSADAGHIDDIYKCSLYWPQI